MDDLDLSGDTTDKEQEDLPYDGDLIENTELLLPHTEIFPSIKEMSEAFQQSVFSNEEMPQIDILRCANDTFLETSVTKKHSEECCTRYFDIPTNNEEPSNSKISDILLHHLSKKGFSNAIQPFDCKTYPEVSIETFDETIFKSLILHCSASSLSREINTDLSDQLLHKRNVMCNQSSQRQLTEKEKIFHFDFEEPVIPEDCFPGDPYLITENRSPSYLQTMCSGQTAQKCLFERLSSDSRLKYGQDQVHDPLSDFFQVTPQIRIYKPNSHHRLATVIQQTNSAPNLNEKSAVVQGDLESMAMNFLDRKPQENKEETIELTQYLQSMTDHVEGQNLIDHLKFNTKVNGEPLLDVSERAFSGLASETNVLKLSSTTKEQLPSSPSQLLTKAEMCQELSEQTKNLKTKVEEFSKRISQDFTPLEDNKQVLEELQHYLDVLEESYLSTKEKHRVLQKCHKDSTAIGEFDPERKVEGEIFKVEMLLENVKEKIDESTSSSFFACSSDTLDFLDFALCPLPNEVPPQKIGHDPSEKSDLEIKLLDLEKQDQENTVIPFLKEKDKDINQKEVIPAEIQETVSQDYLCELYPQIYLGLPRRDVAFDEDASKYSSKEEVVTLTQLETNQLAVKLSADFMIESKVRKASGPQKVPRNNHAMGYLVTFGHSILLYSWPIFGPLPHKIISDFTPASLIDEKKRAFSSLESDNDPGSLESIKQSVLRQDWHSDHELPESSKHTEYPLLKKDQDKDRDLRNQKKEKKNDSRKSKCGKFSVIIQEKAMNLNVSDSTYCTDAGNGVFSDSRDTSKPDECLSCRNRRHKSRKKEFHYKYNCTGQNPLNFNECDGFIRFCSLSRNKSFTSASTHQKWDENLAEHPKNQHSKRSEKNKPVCSQQKKYQPLRITTKCSQSQDEMILAEKRNLMSSKSCPGICDQIANSPHYHSCRISGSKTLHSIQNIKRNDSEILNSALDYALRTAITLKETTEQMIQAIAKDLAKAEGRRNRQKF